MDKKLKNRLSALLISSLLALPATADANEQIAGEWAAENGKSRIRIYECGAFLCSAIVWLKNPRKDINNENPALRGRDLIGAQIAAGMRPVGPNKWTGDVYSTKKGKTFPSIASLSDDVLTIKGCLTGAHLLCKTVKFTRSKDVIR